MSWIRDLQPQRLKYRQTTTWPCIGDWAIDLVTLKVSSFFPFGCASLEILPPCHTSVGGLVALHKGGDGIGTSCGSQEVQGSNPLAATLGLALLYG